MNKKILLTINKLTTIACLLTTLWSMPASTQQQYQQNTPTRNRFSQERKRFSPSSPRRQLPRRPMRPQFSQGPFSQRRPVRPYSSQPARRSIMHQPNIPLEQDLQRIFEQEITPIAQQFNQMLKSSYVEQEITRKKRKREEKTKRTGMQRQQRRAGPPAGRGRRSRLPSHGMGSPWGGPSRPNPFGGFPGRRSPWAGPSGGSRFDQGHQSRGAGHQPDRSFQSAGNRIRTSGNDIDAPSSSTSSPKENRILSSGKKSKTQRDKKKQAKKDKKKLEKRKKIRESAHKAFKNFVDEANAARNAHKKLTKKDHAQRQLINRFEDLNDKLTLAQSELSGLTDAEKKTVLDNNKADLTAFGQHLLQAIPFFLEKYKTTEDFAQQRDHVRHIFQTLNSLLGDEATKTMINGFVANEYSRQKRNTLLSDRKTNEQQQQSAQDLNYLISLLPHESETLTTLQADLQARIVARGQVVPREELPAAVDEPVEVEAIPDGDPEIIEEEIEGDVE